MANEKSDAFVAGYDACYKNKSESSNPYDPQSDDFLSWNDGFNEAAEERDGE